MAPTNVPDAVPEIERATLRRVTWRILPFLMLAYFIAFVDRVNAGFAALQMNHDIGLSAAQFGLGGGLFYVSYVLCEVPSNLAMERFGARIWIARIMITWGLVSAAMAFVVGPVSFYAVRLLLGAAEAGFFPGVILYLTYWFPRAYRGRIVAVFMVAIPISSFLGSPISAAILNTDGMLGFRGWQWLFILEALPAVLLGVIAFAILPDGPAQARWLAPQQRAWLQDRLSAERASVVDSQAAPARHLSVWQVMRNRYVLAASLIYAGASGASQCLSLWQPQIIKSFGLTNLETGLLNSVPFGIASVLMILWGRSSDRKRERVWHTALPLGLLALSLAASIATAHLLPTILILCLAVTATYTVKGPFWALSTEWLSAGAAAAGIAQINAIGNIGGFVGTYLLGVIKDATGSYPLGLLPLVILSGLGCLLVIGLGRGRAQAAAPARA
ncbi:sugar phosphate permease [Methylobacterium brachiatum]|uniref:Sugar phosphate permease n=1 Tax=Methylobacterium brachiatum TaxID=269660 RepID=A0AAJ1TIR2_9HYPH|nr:MFS transporter [Methylobacterium brachiatum]MCB4800487.1 MFS transporter [Methylobacterium brachiatum]MDQ0541760.1 sugar phosphate permease [Methylobacterium brachiatum]